MGIITYEMVVGELPYKGNNISQLLHNISHQSLIFPPDIGLSEEIKCEFPQVASSSRDVARVFSPLTVGGWAGGTGTC